MIRSALVALAVLFTTGCVSAQVHLKPEVSAERERALAGADRFLRVSMYATPFFGDATKKLLTPVPPEQVRFLENPNGSPVNPGAIEATFPAGTPVRILKVEFPTSFVMQERVLYTPRTLAWLYLDVGGTPKGAPPYVIVLRPGIQDGAEFDTAVEQHLVAADPRAKLEGFSEPVRDAIKTKKAIVDMPADALEMAWGWPERKKIELDGDKRRETWVWVDGLRTAVVVDGRVTELK